MPAAISTAEPGINSYVTRAEADAYLDNSIRTSAWASVSGSDKDRALLMAFQLLQRQRYIGAKTDITQIAAFPRVGVTDVDGNPLSSNAVPVAIESAQIELAFVLSQDPAQEASGGTGAQIKRVSAGSVAVEYFGTVRNGARFPTQVMELLRGLLFGGASLGIVPTETDASLGCSSFNTQSTVSEGYA